MQVLRTFKRVGSGAQSVGKTNLEQNSTGPMYMELFIEGIRQRVLVDTGAPKCFIPRMRNVFATVDGSELVVYQPEKLEVWDGRHKARWLFYGANVEQPILGVDFLNYVGMRLDFDRKEIWFCGNSVRPVAMRNMNRTYNEQETLRVHTIADW